MTCKLIYSSRYQVAVIIFDLCCCCLCVCYKLIGTQCSNIVNAINKDKINHSTQELGATAAPE